MTDEQFEQFVRDRITRLRLQKGVSAYRMSCDLGRGKGYIRSICAGKHMPSLEGFAAICKYFGITLREFFDANLQDPVLFHQVMEEIRQLEEKDALFILHYIKQYLSKTCT